MINIYYRHKRVFVPGGLLAYAIMVDFDGKQSVRSGTITGMMGARAAAMYVLAVSLGAINKEHRNMEINVYPNNHKIHKYFERLPNGVYRMYVTNRKLQQIVQRIRSLIEESFPNLKVHRTNGRTRGHKICTASLGEKLKSIGRN